jgi:hypothetical protein
MTEARDRVPLDGKRITGENDTPFTHRLIVIPIEFTAKACKAHFCELYFKKWRDLTSLSSKIDLDIWFALSILEGEIERTKKRQEIALPNWWINKNIIEELKRHSNKSDPFNYRLMKGNSYEDECFSRLSRMGFKVRRHGLEHIHPNLHNTLRNSSDPTSELNRFQPDQLIQDMDLGNSCFIEVKHSDTIEKRPYQTYKALSDAFNCKVLICIKSKLTNAEYWVPIQSLELIPGSISVKEFPPEERLPVDSDGWIAPRLLKKEASDYFNYQKYIEWKKRSKGSGTPFRYFDFEVLTDFKNWAYYPHRIKEWLSDHKIFMNVLVDETEAR